MREHRLLQPKRSEGRRRRPGYFQVIRPDELWHLDMTSVWVAEHGSCYLHAAIDCCTREIVGWALDVCCRAQEAIAVIDQAVAERAGGAGRLPLGTDNGTAFTPRALRASPRRAPDRASPRRLARPGVPGVHRVVVLKAQGSAASGEGSSRRSMRPAPSSAPTSTAITTGPTKGSPTARRPKLPGPGQISKTSQSQRPDRQRRRGPRHYAGPEDDGAICQWLCKRFDHVQATRWSPSIRLDTSAFQGYCRVILWRSQTPRSQPSTER